VKNEAVRRSILRQGFVVLLVAFATGFGIVAGGPAARGWMATHVTLMISAIFTILVGLVWNDLALGARARAVLRFTVVLNGYWGLATGAFATVFAIPGPVSGGGAVPPDAWHTTVFFAVFIPIATILPFMFGEIALFGLRGARTPAAAVD
jgi:hypothetical protein